MDTSSIAGSLIQKGAEAELFLSTIIPWQAVLKRRVEKKYRKTSLDHKIRAERTVDEALIIHEAKRAGVSVPSILGIQPETYTIAMTAIDGVVARDQFDQMSGGDSRLLFKSLGGQIGLMHAAGIVHGDLTTSNVIITPSGSPFIVDFGMSRRSTEPEDRGVDLHLLQRSMTASHVLDIRPLVEALAQGYTKTAGQNIADSSWAKAREIARRGRYFAIR